MRLALALVLLLPLALFSACQTTAPAAGAAPPTALQTFDTLYANAVTVESLVVTTATTALQAGLINATQAKKILAATDAAKVVLDTANAAAQVGNTGAATANLAAALGPVAMLSACLTVKPLTTATFDSCAARLTPPAVQ